MTELKFEASTPDTTIENEESPLTTTPTIYCTCRHATLCKKCGIPMNTKDDTKREIDALIHDDRPAIASVFGNGPLLLSNVPESALNSDAGVVLGIE